MVREKSYTLFQEQGLSLLDRGPRLTPKESSA